MNRLRYLLCLAALPAALIAQGSALQAQAIEDYDYENLEFRGIGMDFGMVDPVRMEPAFSMGVRADLGFLGPNVRIMPGLSFWSSTLREAEVNRLADQIRRVGGGETTPELGEIFRSDLTLNADAHYVWYTDFNVRPYLGAGGAVHFLNGRGDAIDGTFVEDLLTTATPGVNAIAGVDVPLGPNFALTAEARYGLTTDVLVPALNVGGTWFFGGPAAPVSARERY